MLSRGGSTTWASALCVAALVALGSVVGVLWVWWAPRVRVVVSDGQAFLADPESQAAIATDGRFAVLAVAAGVVSGVALYGLLRARGPWVPVVLAVGGVAGSVLAWRLGVLLGPDRGSAAARGGAAGGTVDLPLQLRALGVLVVWPLVAVVSHLVLTATFERVEPAGAWRTSPPDDEVRTDAGPQRRWR